MAQFDCFKCGGTGKVSFRHIQNGDCFQCGATGRLSYQPRIVQADPHPELLVSGVNAGTSKQWDYLVKLCKDDDRIICRILKDAGAPMATLRYCSKSVMSKAIELAKG